MPEEHAASIPMQAQPVIVHETEDWLVVSKPGGWHSVRQDRNDPNCVLQTWLAEHRPELRRVGSESGLVHRLDQLTSGALLVARNPNAYDRLTAAMRAGGHGRITKQYVALVEGSVWRDEGFELYFESRYKRSRQVTVAPTGRASQRGRCRWRVVGPVDEGTLLIVDLIGPGRRHQIRAGLASLGFPLRGDVLYGGRPWDVGLGLHAWRLAVDGVNVTCDVPSSWNVRLPDELVGDST